MNRKHYVIYFDDNKQLIYTTPKDWARDHENEFPDYNFEIALPTTDKISAYLISNYGFTRIESQNVVITIQL
jgi:hypothetical protein